MKISKTALIAAALLAAPSLLFADFSYQETTQITGGTLVSVFKTVGVFSSQARHATDPVVSMTYVKGNRMARVSPDNIEIIDLDKETITSADPQKRTYTVVTFEQLKEQAAAAAQKMREEQAKEQAQAPAPADAKPENTDVKTSFDVKMRKTGATRTLSGLQAEEAILTMMMNATDTKTAQSGAMGITDDLWLAPEPDGYKEMREFSERMADKMGLGLSGSGANGGSPMSALLANQPGAAEALSNLKKQMQDVKGMPVLQVLRMGMTTNGQPLPAASEAPLPASSPSSGEGAKVGQVAQQDAADSAASEASRHLGRFGNFGNLAGGFGSMGHKKKAEQAPPPASAQTAPPTSAVLLESKSESSNFSTSALDDSHFAVPDGYRQIASGLVKSGQ